MGGKNSAGGPPWAIKQDKLLETLKQEQQHMDNLLADLPDKIPNGMQEFVKEQVQEVIKAARLWIKLYHSLVLLNAALSPPDEQAVWRYKKDDDIVRKNNKCFLTDCHLTVAWTDGPQSEESWLGYDVSDQALCLEPEESDVEPKNDANDSLSRIFEEEFSRSSELGDDLITLSIAQSRNSVPILFNFLTKFKRIFPTFRDFDLKNCLETCLRSAQSLKSTQLLQLEPHSANINKEIYIEKALYLIAEIWGGDVGTELPDLFWNEDFNPNLIRALQQEDSQDFESWVQKVSNRLTEIKMIDWSEGLEMGTIKFPDWLREYHWAASSLSDSPEDLLTKAVTSHKSEITKMIRGMVAMLEVNEEPLLFIYNRCFDGSSSFPHPGLEGLIEKLDFEISPDLSEDDAIQQYQQYQTQWSNLQFATYGTLIWHIFHQVTPVVKQLRIILEED